MRQIEAIALDLDDTLWAFAPAQARAEAALHGWLLRHAPATAPLLPGPASLQVLRAQTAQARPELAGRPDLVRRASIRSLLAAVGGDLALSETAYEVFYAARQRVDLYDDVLPALHWLSQRWPLIAITNGNSDLAATAVDGFFHSAVRAYDVGVAKPDARIFHAAAEVLGVPPTRMLHVGDDWALDVVGAKRAGLQAGWLVRAGMAVVPPDTDVRPDVVVRDLHALCDVLRTSGPGTSFAAWPRPHSTEPLAGALP